MSDQPNAEHNTSTQTVSPPPPPPIPPGAAASGGDSEGRRRGRGSGGGGGIFLGVLLVVVGALTLMGRFAPGMHVAWWAAWPLIVVVIGAVQIFTPGDSGWGLERVLEGIGTMIFGFVLLGCTTGYISWGVWWTLVTLWPALVIALGLGILGQGLGQTWLRVMATLVVWLTLAFAVSMSWTGAGGVPSTGVWMRTGGQPFSYSEPVGGVSKANLQLRAGAGAIEVGSGGKLIDVSGASPYGAPTFSAKRSGDRADIAVGMGDPHGSFVVVPGVVAPSMRVRLADNVLWDAVMETGASSVDADLSDVKVRNLELKSGASAVVVRLGKVPAGVTTSTLVVKSGVSSVTILVPKGEKARVDTQNGLVATDVGSGFESLSGAWETPGYSHAERSWNIRTEAGVGSVKISLY